MIDMTKFRPDQLSERDRKLQEYELNLERLANEAQKRVNESEVVDGRPNHKRKLLGPASQP